MNKIMCVSLFKTSCIVKYSKNKFYATNIKINSKNNSQNVK